MGRSSPSPIISKKIPFVSICIPTYERGDYLDSTLRSLFFELEKTPDACIEIIVNDNGSTDNTDTIIAKWQKKLPLRYYKLNENKGSDFNFYAAAQHARGSYIWWFCSDDHIEPDALIQLIRYLQEYTPECAYINHNLYNLDMSENLGPHPMLAFLEQPQLFKNATECILNIGFMFGFLGAIIIRSESFFALDEPLKFNHTCYSHVGWMFEVLLKGGSCLYINTPLIQHRTGNDSFLTNGAYRRMRIDVEGFDKIGRYYLSLSVFKKFYSHFFMMHVSWRLYELAKLDIRTKYKVFQTIRDYLWKPRMDLNFQFVFKIIIFTFIPHYIFQKIRPQKFRA